MELKVGQGEGIGETVSVFRVMIVGGWVLKRAEARSLRMGRAKSLSWFDLFSAIVAGRGNGFN